MCCSAWVMRVSLATTPPTGPGAATSWKNIWTNLLCRLFIKTGLAVGTAWGLTRQWSQKKTPSLLAPAGRLNHRARMHAMEEDHSEKSIAPGPIKVLTAH